MNQQQSPYTTRSGSTMLGALTAFSAGMANVVSVIVFFAFTSNVTGHYAILAQEIAKGNWYEAAIVMLWVLLFLVGNITSNLIIINAPIRKGSSLVRSMPLLLETICLLGVGIYLQHGYQETLQETEILVGIMLFAMGLQNGLTATISNFTIKTTHLTGLTTDLGLLISMFTKRIHREDSKLRYKAQLMLVILVSYMIGGITAGLVHHYIQGYAFCVVALVLLLTIIYDFMASNQASIPKSAGNTSQFTGSAPLSSQN